MTQCEGRRIEGVTVSATPLIPVMSAALKQLQFIFGNAVDDSIGAVDPPGPPARKLSPQRLGLADALKGTALNVPDEHIDAFEH